MTLFSITERELRVRARQRFTTSLRVLIGLLATLLRRRGSNSRPRLPVWSETGKAVFGVLTWLCFTFCLIEGRPADSGQRLLREAGGTLGLLFLTDLRGLDVALGKLVASSLYAFYALLAAFPVLGVSLALGGVTAGELAHAIGIDQHAVPRRDGGPLCECAQSR